MSLRWGRGRRLLDERDPGGESVGWKGGTWTLRKPSWKETKLLQLPLEIALFNMQSTAVFRRHLSIHHPMQIPTLGKRSPCKSLDSPNQVCVGDSSVPKEQHRAGQATAYHSQRLDKEKKKRERLSWVDGSAGLNLCPMVTCTPGPLGLGYRMKLIL